MIVQRFNKVPRTLFHSPRPSAKCNQIRCPKGLNLGFGRVSTEILVKWPPPAACSHQKTLSDNKLALKTQQVASTPPKSENRGLGPKLEINDCERSPPTHRMHQTPGNSCCSPSRKTLQRQTHPIAQHGGQLHVVSITCLPINAS